MILVWAKQTLHEIEETVMFLPTQKHVHIIR